MDGVVNGLVRSKRAQCGSGVTVAWSRMDEWTPGCFDSVQGIECEEWKELCAASADCCVQGRVRHTLAREIR